MNTPNTDSDEETTKLTAEWKHLRARRDLYEIAINKLQQNDGTMSQKEERQLNMVLESLHDAKLKYDEFLNVRMHSLHDFLHPKN